MSDEPNELSFNLLPIAHRYNILIRHNKRLIKENNLLTEYSEALKYQLEETENQLLKKQRTQPPIITEKEVIVEKEVKVLTPDAIGETMALRKRLLKNQEQLDKFVMTIGKLNSEIASLKKYIRRGRV